MYGPPDETLTQSSIPLPHIPPSRTTSFDRASAEDRMSTDLPVRVNDWRGLTISPFLMRKPLRHLASKHPPTGSSIPLTILSHRIPSLVSAMISSRSHSPGPK